VIWISLQTGVPAKPAQNVARLAPGFQPSFGLLSFVLAVVATVAWLALVRWRTKQNPQAMWKSLVLPAGGTALAWLLVMTLWLPVLNYARSYSAPVQRLTAHIDGPGCVQAFGLTRAQITALMYHGHMDLRAASTDSTCPWLIVAGDLELSMPTAFDKHQWTLVARIPRPTDARENLLLYKKK
jgi:hypothetical protein